MSTPKARAVSQYSTTTGNLTARMVLHAYGTNPQDWFAWLSGRLPLGRDVLEAGAGTGALWNRVGHRGRRLTLTDFSPAMCARLVTVPGAEVVRCDAACLPFGEAGFDTVVANHMLYHLDDPDAALREFARVLRPGGRLAVAVNGPGHMRELREVGAVIGRPGLVPAGFLNGFDAVTGPARVARWFGDVTVERYPCDLDVPTVEPILAYLASIADDAKVADDAEVARDAGIAAGPLGEAARSFVEARIAVDGSFRIRKHTVLIRGSR